MTKTYTLTKKQIFEIARSDICCTWWSWKWITACVSRTL